MSPGPNVRATRHRLLVGGGAVALAAAVIIVARAVDPAVLAATLAKAVADPSGIALALSLYAAAFFVRAWAWHEVLPELPFGHALAALHVSLAGNHVLPLRLGEALRVSSVVRRTGVGLPAALSSTVLLRAGDILALLAIAGATGSAVLGPVAGGWAWIAILPAAGLFGGALWWIRRRKVTTRVPVLVIAASAVLGWVLESAVVWQAARWAGIDLSAIEAVAVTSVTIAAQTVAIAPGGIATYEAAATASMVALGAGPGLALAAAVAAHAVKTAYSLVTGAAAAFFPPPGALGRLRLPKAPANRKRGGAAPDGPVVLVLPARNEEDSVAGVIARVPATVHGRPVRVVVVDDGSTDRTAARAARAGAEVVSHPAGAGLGAAIRRGLSEGRARGAAAIAFCDADGEYAPEELGAMVGPILEDRADYVVGSRFAGDIRRMLPHRRAGNKVLTRALRFVARTPISDGQSGYRALSSEAAAAAEIIHDFNYAQVLTLDLLAKGFRYLEVPISYSFRTSGRSFVRLGRYLRAVVPAVYRELNRA